MNFKESVDSVKPITGTNDVKIMATVVRFLINKE